MKVWVLRKWEQFKSVQRFSTHPIWHIIYGSIFIVVGNVPIIDLPDVTGQMQVHFNMYITAICKLLLTVKVFKRMFAFESLAFTSWSNTFLQLLESATLPYHSCCILICRWLCQGGITLSNSSENVFNQLANAKVLNANKRLNAFE